MLTVDKRKRPTI
jgi:hypothetical protein